MSDLRTHWEGCHTLHIECAIELINKLRKRLTELSEYFAIAGKTMYVSLRYPQTHLPNKIRISLEDVRMADDIQVTYDFDRDGWVISQATYTEGEGFTKSNDDYAEVAFIKAWGREKG